jgi:hypothetical protein
MGRHKLKSNKKKKTMKNYTSSHIPFLAVQIRVGSAHTQVPFRLLQLVIRIHKAIDTQARAIRSIAITIQEVLDLKHGELGDNAKETTLTSCSCYSGGAFCLHTGKPDNHFLGSPEIRFPRMIAHAF